MTGWKRHVGILGMVLVLIGMCSIGVAQIDINLPWAKPGAYSGNAIDFGAVLLGQTKTVQYTFKILETSDTGATVTITRPNPPFGSDAPTHSFTLAPGQSITFNVTFTPPGILNYTGSFTITAQGGHPVQTKRQTVTLTGEGVVGIEDTYPPTTAPPTTAPPTTAPPIWTPGQGTTTTPDVTEDVIKLEAKLDTVGKTLDELRQKLDNLAGILGEWIVGRGQPFFIEPGTTGYNPPAPTTGIKGEIEDLGRKTDELISQLGKPDTALLELLPIEVTPNAGDRFRAFFELADRAHVQAAEDLLAVNPENEYMREVLRTASQALLDVRPEISELIALSQTLPLDMQARVDAVISDADIAFQHEAIFERPSSISPKFKVAIDTEAVAAVKKVARKAAETLGAANPWGVPVGKAAELVLRDLEDIEDRNTIVMKTLVGMSLAQLELEKKLDAIVRGLFGVPVHEGMDEAELQAALRKVPLDDFPERFKRLNEELDELRQKLDNIGWWLGKLTTGSPIGVEPGSTNVMPQTNLWTLLGALEAKLDQLASGQLELSKLINETAEELGVEIDKFWEDMEILLGYLEAKLDELAIGLRDVALLITDMWDDMGDRFNDLNGAIASARRAITDAITAAETAIKTAITTTETAITTRIGTAETNIRTDITTAETNINANITAAQTAIQADIAVAQGAILGGMGRNNQAILANANLIKANTTAINGVLGQVNANGALIQDNSNDIQTLMNMVLNLQESNNRVEDKLNHQLGYPGAPDHSKITLGASALVGEIGAVDPNSLVTVYWPTGDQTTVTAGSDGSFSVAVPPKAVGCSFAEVTQTDSEGNESARVIAYASP